jgi:hypothetical protein
LGRAARTGVKNGCFLESFVDGCHQTHHLIQIRYPKARVAIRSRLLAIPGRVVRHPIEDHAKTLLVRRCHKMLQILEISELSIDAVLILDRVRTAQRALAIFATDLMNWHQPQDVRTQGFEPRQMRFGGPKRAFNSELPQVDLVNRGAFAPLGMLEFHVRHGLVRVWLLGIARGSAVGGIQGSGIASDFFEYEDTPFVPVTPQYFPTSRLEVISGDKSGLSRRFKSLNQY